jgi:hypothetical protein
MEIGSLNGVWNVRRTGGLLPPLVGVRKVIEGDHGETRVGRMPGMPFQVRDGALHYRSPFAGFVAVIEPGGGAEVRGRATFRGRTFGRFAMTRLPPPGGPSPSPRSRT